MLRVPLLLASAAVASAQGPAGATYYGISPDDTIPGLVNLFRMSVTGQPLGAVASIPTRDDEYPKIGTLHCSWTQPVCWFATGIGANYVQDAIIAVSTATGQTLWRHELPAGIYIDNLAYDYITETLFSIAFRPDGVPGGYGAALVSYNGVTGNVTIVADLTRDFRNGKLYPGSFSICPTDKTMFIGIDADDGEFSDFIAEYEYFTPGAPRFVGAKPLLFPIPSTIHAVCSNRSLEGIYAVTIQSDSQDRETALVGDVNVFGREGLFFPRVKGDLPVLPNNQPLYLTGMMTDFLGVALIPVYSPFQRGEPIPFGGLWTIDFRAEGRPNQILSPMDYFLAGAAGVPTR